MKKIKNSKIVNVLEKEYEGLYRRALQQARQLIYEKGSLYKCALLSGQKSITTFSRIMKKEDGHNLELLIRVCRNLQEQK